MGTGLMAVYSLFPDYKANFSNKPLTSKLATPILISSLEANARRSGERRNSIWPVRGLAKIFV